MADWRRELERRRDEALARAKVRLVNRSLRRRPTGIDRIAGGMVARAAGPADPDLAAELSHDTGSEPGTRD